MTKSKTKIPDMKDSKILLQVNIKDGEFHFLMNETTEVEFRALRSLLGSITKCMDNGLEVDMEDLEE